MANRKPTKKPQSGRPYRIWDWKANRTVPYRCYKSAERSHGRIRELIWDEDIGTTWDVFDSRTSAHVARYIHKLDRVEYIKVRKTGEVV